MAETVVCTRCGTENPALASHCHKCGGTLATGSARAHETQRAILAELERQSAQLARINLMITVWSVLTVLAALFWVVVAMLGS